MLFEDFAKREKIAILHGRRPYSFFLFSGKDEKPSSGGEGEGRREKQENMPEERKAAR